MNLKGFTLIELVITIAVIIVLSSISVPIYRGYVKKAAMAEGYILLGAIRDAQLRYKGEYGNFYRILDSNATSNDPVLGINARANKYYRLFTPGWAHWGLDYKGNFGIWVGSSKYGNINMIYNVTSGVTVW